MILTEEWLRPRCAVMNFVTEVAGRESAPNLSLPSLDKELAASPSRIFRGAV
jgi:hypothetical protein